MPADITGTNMLTDDPSGRKVFEFQRGPVFAHIVLADEINRATPKTQSALLEAMQEQSVTVGGKMHRLENPFMVLATQNPIEMEGTYPLPEAQVDRFFFKLLLAVSEPRGIGAHCRSDHRGAAVGLREIVDAGGILQIRQWVQRGTAGRSRQGLCGAAGDEHAIRNKSTKTASGGLAERFVMYGSSPRGLQSLILAAKARALLAGRPNVSFDDIRTHAAAEFAASPDSQSGSRCGRRYGAKKF